MAASPVRVDRPAEGHPRALGHAVERGLGADLVEAGVERLGGVEVAHDRRLAVAGQRGALLGVDRQVVPAHEHMFAQRDGRTGQAPPSLAACSSAETVSATGVATPWRRPRRADHAVARLPLQGAAGDAVGEDRRAGVGRQGLEPRDDVVGVAFGQVDALRARHGGAFVGERAGDLADVVEGEDLRRASGERHDARDRVGAQLAPRLARELAADRDLGVGAEQRRQPLPRRPVRDREAQRVALAHAARLDRLHRAPVDDGQHLRRRRPAAPTRSAWSMPFCRTATVVPSPHSADSQSAAPCVWCALTARMHPVGRSLEAARDRSAAAAASSTDDPSGRSTTTRSTGRARAEHQLVPARGLHGGGHGRPMAPTPTTATRAMEPSGRRAREQRLLAGQRLARRAGGSRPARSRPAARGRRS